MPLFDLFKKPFKKEVGKSFLPDDSPFAPEAQKKRYEAAMEFLKSFQERIPLLGGRPHAGTILSIAARLAGTSLYRALNSQKDIPPGTVVLSEEVNQAWPQLLDLFAFHCKQNGIDVMVKPPVTEFPDKDKPRMSLEQVRQEYQDQYDEIMKRHNLEYLEAARAGMVLASIVFQYHCTVAKDIDPYVGTGIIAMGVVEGAKTAPAPSGRIGSMPENKIENENRLVLGESEAAIAEALDHGGIFIEPNPEVLQALRQGNIDPYLIYERALRNEIEKKIARIDFVRVDVDGLFEEWKRKPQNEAPIHVRLIIWLKNNAATYGYEQSGNSWVLKN